MRVSRVAPIQFPNQTARSQRSNQNSAQFSTAVVGLNSLGSSSKGAPVRSVGGLASLFSGPISNRPSKSHDSVTVDNTLALAPDIKAAASQPKAADGPSLTGNISIDAIALVSANLRKRGFDPANFSFTYSDEPVSFPGGSYANRQITARVNGHTEQYDAGLVMKNPEIAAVEILRLIGQTA